MYEFTKIPLNCEMPKESNSKTAAKRLTKKFDSPFFFFFCPQHCLYYWSLVQPKISGRWSSTILSGTALKKKLTISVRQSVSGSVITLLILQEQCRCSFSFFFIKSWRHFKGEGHPETWNNAVVYKSISVPKDNELDKTVKSHDDQTKNSQPC